MKVPYVIKDRRPSDIAICYCDPGKEAEELGWKAENGIKEMCEDSWRWQNTNQDLAKQIESSRDLYYSKKIHGDRMLRKLDPAGVANKCRYFFNLYMRR